MGGVDERDAGALEAGTREAASVDTGQLAHNLVDGDELGRTALVVVDGALARVEAQLAEELQVTRLPCRHSLAHPSVL